MVQLKSVKIDMSECVAEELVWDIVEMLNVGALRNLMKEIEK